MAESSVRRVRIEPYVPEAWLARVISAGVSPSEFAEFVLSRSDVGEWLAAFAAGGAGHARGAPQSFASEPSEAEVPSNAWSRPKLEAFLSEVTRLPEFRWPVSLLSAYVKLDNPNPTGAELQAAAGFPSSAPAWEQVWHQELRAAKARLTIHARRKGLAEPLFDNPSSTSSGRMHPLRPDLFEWLRDWARRHPQALPPPERWGSDIASGPKYASTLLRGLQ